MFIKGTRDLFFCDSTTDAEFHSVTFNEVLMAFQLEPEAPEVSACGFISSVDRKCSNALTLVLMA